MRTNALYLNKIDSIKYTKLFSKLKVENLGDIMINSDGRTDFVIKKTTQLNNGDYNENYIHELIYINCDCPVNYMADTVFLDSTINKEWKYIFYKTLSGW